MAALDQLLVQGLAGQTKTSDFPVALLTGTGTDPRPRLRVDPAQTSFLEGRQFRTFHELNIPSGQSLFGRFITAGDVVVLHRHITVVQGNLRFALCTGGTPGGTWTAKTVHGVNGMASRPTPLYSPSTTAAFGGTLTGQTEIDLSILETGTSQAVAVQGTAEEMGLPAGTYYVEIRNTGANALRGLYTVVWEEYQPRSSRIFGGSLT